MADIPIKQVTGDDKIESDLAKALRRRGLLVPVAEDQVRLAEQRLTASKVNIPKGLETPPVIPPAKARLRPVFLLQKGYWRHPSILALAKDNDPIEVMTTRVRQVICEALEAGWEGPPYDPFLLAELRNIATVPSQEVIDARTKASAGNRFVIEFNPSRPPARIRYSIAHEIGHTLFPDCAHAIRNRATHEQMGEDEWQLELLCNLAAAEILMPIGSLQDIRQADPSIDVVVEYRKRYQVSAEAVMLRLARLTTQRCFVFASHRDPRRQRYSVDYVFSSKVWDPGVRPGFLLPKPSKVSECTAIGFTAKGREEWRASEGAWNVEYLGIPPYPGQAFPRVVGIARPLRSKSEAVPAITFVRGDALQPRDRGVRVVLQIVNDLALRWGGGFALAARKKWPDAQGAFTDWVSKNRRELRLGNVHFAKIDDSLVLASLVAQHGYGPSPRPRIRYGALSTCFEKVAEYAIEHGASLHMPRIGSGQSGGVWDIVRELVEDSLCSRRLRVTVYDLPVSEHQDRPGQRALPFGSRKSEDVPI